MIPEELVISLRNDLIELLKKLQHDNTPYSLDDPKKLMQKIYSYYYLKIELDL